MKSISKKPAPTLGSRFSAWLLRRAGWNITPFPEDIQKAVVVGGPHTSNWDGVLAVLSGSALGLDSRVLVKNNLFFWPLGPVLKKLGAIPINRGQSSGVVEQAAAEFRQREKLILIVTPEGTRRSAPRWKTGFYYIALQAEVPIVLATADYNRKELSYPRVIRPSGDLEADLHKMYSVFSQVTPRHPERLSGPVKALRARQQGEKS